MPGSAADQFESAGSGHKVELADPPFDNAYGIEQQEDPRLDHSVCKCTADDHVITIASAGKTSDGLDGMLLRACASDLCACILSGCNVFDYLIEGAKVTAVDLNAAQIALTDLKQAAVQKLDFQEFFAIFGKNDVELLRSKYETVLRPMLLERSQQFWDQKIGRYGDYCAFERGERFFLRTCPSTACRLLLAT